MYAPPLDDAALLAIWERSLPLERPWRELALLADASGEPVEVLAGLPIGERDRRLLDLRERLFGADVEGEIACPSCGERLELRLALATMCLPVPATTERDAPAEDRSAAGCSVQGSMELEAGGWRLTLRLPDSSDVAASVAAAEPEAELVRRCIATATLDGEALAPDAVPDALLAEMRERVAERLAELDPQADVVLDLSCPACGQRWEAAFDPAAFLLDEVSAYAGRLIADVHELARAYGWREPDVLALGPVRRRRYLELALG
jgi:uncharacterized protein (UPF0212 family)